MKDVSNLSCRVCFILAEPSHPGNIGSAARAVKTMGFTDLRVVSPKCPEYREHPDAVAMATSSVDVLRSSTSYTTLSQALEDVLFAFALSGYNREFGPPIEALQTSTRRAALLLANPQVGSGKIAFVFGCERSGLTNEEMALCQACSAIAANPESPSLNLAQAVQITAYEMHLAILKAENHAGELYAWQDRFDHEPIAGVAALEGFFAHWEKAMIACGALDPKEPKNLMEISRRFFTRPRLTQSDVDMLRGICAAVICPKRERIGQKTHGKKQGEKTHS
ncbi:MAG TPA: tRNA methyltransferase [Sutterella sp.]|nr:tRNA methyltransferase [Sutterella sp.]